MGKSPSLEMGLKKGPWTSEEDRKLVSYVEKYGHGSWRTLPPKAGLQRCGKSCRLRWTNYLRPDIKRGKFSLQEEQSIIQLHALLGNRWAAIASHLPRRTDNEIKNYWNTKLKKRLTKMGIDPMTHKSRISVATNLNHMTQWENARLEAEARLVREPRLVFESYHGIQNGSFSLINQPQPQPQPLRLNMLDQACQSITLSKRSYLKGPQTPYSTLKFFEKALSSLSNVQNRSRPVNNPFENTTPSPNMDMATQDCMDDSEIILKEPFNIFDDVSLEENTLENMDILYQDDYMMEALPRPSVGHPISNDFEDNNDDYWIHILDKLGNI